MKFFRQNPTLAAALVCTMAILCACKSGSSGEISIIPAPSSIEVRTEDPFKINTSTQLVALTDDERATAGFFAGKIAASTGNVLTISGENAGNNVIIFDIDPASGIPEEGYSLEAGSDAICVKASDSDGLFYGMQTLLQLLPPETQSDKVLRGINL